MGRIWIAAGIFLACAGMQRWSNEVRRERKLMKQEDLPRWEGEGGAPNPDRAARPEPAAGHATH